MRAETAFRSVPNPSSSGGNPQDARRRGVPQRSESVKLRGNSTGRGAPSRAESVKLRRNSTGRAPTWRSVAFRIRQAKGEIHRMRPAMAFHVVFRSVGNPSSSGGTPQDPRRRGIPRGVLRRSESVKLRGTPQGTRPLVVVLVVVPRCGGGPVLLVRGRGPVAVIPWWFVCGGGPLVVVRGGGPWWWSVVVVLVVPWRWSWWSVVWSRGGGPLMVITWWWSRGGGPVVVVRGVVVRGGGPRWCVVVVAWRWSRGGGP